MIDLEDIIMSLVLRGTCTFGFPDAYAPFIARYTFYGGALHMDVDIRNGKILRLIAGAGYSGRLFDTIEVGMLVRDAMAQEPRLYYDEARAVILCNSCAGVTLDIPAYDPPPELVPDMLISAISVHIAEVETADANRGLW